MLYFVTEMCTHAPISVTKLCIVGYGTGALLLGIVGFVRWFGQWIGTVDQIQLNSSRPSDAYMRR